MFYRSWNFQLYICVSTDYAMPDSKSYLMYCIHTCIPLETKRGKLLMPVINYHIYRQPYVYRFYIFNAYYAFREKLHMHKEMRAWMYFNFAGFIVKIFFILRAQSIFIPFTHSSIAQYVCCFSDRSWWQYEEKYRK